MARSILSTLIVVFLFLCLVLADWLVRTLTSSYPGLGL